MLSNLLRLQVVERGQHSCCDGRVEIWLLRRATKALYGQLLAGGVRVVEYERISSHAKVAAVDGCLATAGSSNIDLFRQLLARCSRI